MIARTSQRTKNCPGYRKVCSALARDLENRGKSGLKPLTEMATMMWLGHSHRRITQGDHRMSAGLAAVCCMLWWSYWWIHYWKGYGRRSMWSVWGTITEFVGTDWGRPQTKDLKSVRTTVSTPLHPTYRAGVLIKRKGPRWTGQVGAPLWFNDPTIRHVVRNQGYHALQGQKCAKYTRLPQSLFIERSALGRRS